MNKYCFGPLFILVFMSLSLLGQDLKSDTLKRGKHDFTQSPVWIEMMKDPHVNYFEACKAFDLFWIGKEIPSESEGEAVELYNEEEKENEHHLEFRNPETYKYIYTYKMFINWRRAMEHKVDPATGNILNPDEQREIWKQQTNGIDTAIK